MKTKLILAARVGAWVLSVFVAFVLGANHGADGAKERRFHAEKEAIAPILAADRSFFDVEIWMNDNDDSAYLLGEVPSVEDRDRLSARMKAPSDGSGLKK